MQTWYFVRGMRSRMKREFHVRFCERLRGLGLLDQFTSAVGVMKNNMEK